MANRRFIDFPIAASVGDNDIVLIWQDGLNKQTTKATLFAGSPNSLAGLTDVDISALANGQILQYNSTTSKWENVDRTDIDLDQLGDVTIVSPTNGQVLVYNSSTSKWENSSAGFVPYTGAVTTVNLGAQSILAGSFVKAGGTSAQFLKADGSVDSTAYGTGSVTSVGLTMPSAFSVANSPVTTAGTLAVTGAGTVAQYVRGDGSLADFPATTGGGASVSYYLNGSVSQGTIGGVAYREFNRMPVFGAGTDITRNSDGYIASFITDAGDPNKLLIPAGNWNLETYFSASSGGGSPTFYVELYKYDGTTFTLIASNSGSPELIAFGTNLNPYFSTLAVPQTTLALTDRLALRYYVNTSGRTITLHTENDHLCQVITTFTTGLTALNGLTTQVQFFAVGTSGTDFNIASATDTHTFNLPTASATNRGALSSADWSTFNNKENAITAGTTAQYFRGDKTFQTLNTSVVPEGTNLYYTEARVNANTNVAANTAARHNAVTLGTANGLSLSTQVLSLGLASAGVTGALSGTDWSTFNSKQNALTNPVTGTGSDGQVAYWSSGSAITGESNLFWDASNDRLGIGINTPKAITEINSGANASAIRISDQNYDGSSSTFRFTAVSYWSRSDGVIRTGTNPLDGNGSTAAIVFTDEPGNFTFNNVVRSSSIEFYTANNNVSGSVGILPTLQFKIASTGAATFSSSVTAVSFIRSGGTSAQFLKADGSVDSTTYVPVGRTITINGTTQDLSANRTFNVGTVTSVTASSPLFSSGGATPNITIQQASGSQNGFLSSTDWTTFNNKQNTLTLTTSGTSGAATLVGSTLNIPNYSADLSGYLPLTGGTLTGGLGGTTASFSSTVSATQFFVNTSGQSRAISTFHPAGAFGSNIWIGGGGANSTLNGGGSALGSTNTSLGVLALEDNTTGNANVAIGYLSLSNNTTGNGNTSAGQFSMWKNTTGYSNSAFGQNSLIDHTTGFANCAFGTNSLGYLTTGRYNVGFGSWAGYLINSGAENRTSIDSVYLGDDTRASANGNENEIVIGKGGRGQGSNSAVIGNANITKTVLRGNVLIKTTSDSGESLQVRNGRSLFELASGTNGAILKLGRSAGAYYWHLGISGATSFFEFYDNNLNVLSNINVSTGAYTAVSDKNKKKDFEPSILGLNEIVNLKPTLYRMINDSNNSKKHLGFIAQEVKDYIPQAYVQSEDFIGLNYNSIIPVLVNAIKELKQEIDTLKN
jgi:hypothetical protein